MNDHNDICLTDFHSFHQQDGLLRRFIQNPVKLDSEEKNIILTRLNSCSECVREYHKSHIFDEDLFSGLKIPGEASLDVWRKIQHQLFFCPECQRIKRREEHLEQAFPETVIFQIPPEVIQKKNWVWFQGQCTDLSIPVTKEFQKALIEMPENSLEKFNPDDFTDVFDDTGKHELLTVAVSPEITFCLDKTKAAILFSVITDVDLGDFEVRAGPIQAIRIHSSQEEPVQNEKLPIWHYKFLLCSFREFMGRDFEEVLFTKGTNTVIRVPIVSDE